MKCMTPSVAASQRSRRGALARGLHMDGILPVETQRQKKRFAEPHFFQTHWGVPLQIWDTWETRWCHRVEGGGLRSICRGVFCGRWFVSRGIGGGARIFQEQFLRLGSEGENRYSLGLSDGSGAEADASISCLPSVNNTPPLYCAERMTAFSVSCASPRIAV